MTKKILIGLLIVNFVLVSCGAMFDAPTPEQAKIRSFKIGSETIYQIIAPDEDLIKLNGDDVGLEFQWANMWINIPGRNEDEALVAYFRKNVDAEYQAIKATCGFGAAFIAYNLATLLRSNDPKISKDKDDLYKVFYNDADFEGQFHGWVRPELVNNEEVTNMYKINSEKFKDFFKNAIPIVVQYRRDKHYQWNETYQANLSAHEISALVSRYLSAIPDVEDKIVLIDKDYDPAAESKKDVLREKINAVITDSEGKTFTIFICLNLLQAGAHWLTIIIRKNVAKEIEILFSDTANQDKAKFEAPIFHVIELVKELKSAGNFEQWVKNELPYADDLLKDIVAQPAIKQLYQNYYDGLSAVAQKSAKNDKWFSDAIEEKPLDKRLERELRKYFLKPKCKLCMKALSKPIALPCGMVFTGPNELTRKKEYDHRLICQDCFKNRFFDEKAEQKFKNKVYSKGCPCACLGYTTYAFKKLLEDNNYNDDIILACAMYYGQGTPDEKEKEKEQRIYGNSFLDKFIPLQAKDAVEKGAAIGRAKAYLERIKMAQKEIMARLGGCGVTAALKKFNLNKYLEEEEEASDLPKLGVDWLKKQKAIALLDAPSGGFSFEGHAVAPEILALRLLELDARPEEIIAKLIELSEKIKDFDLSGFINRKQQDILATRRLAFIENFDKETNEALDNEKSKKGKEDITKGRGERRVLLLNQLDENSNEIKNGLQEILDSLKKKVQPVLPLKNDLKKLAIQLGTLKAKLKNLQGKLTLLRGKLAQKKKTK